MDIGQHTLEGSIIQLKYPFMMVESMKSEANLHNAEKNGNWDDSIDRVLEIKAIIHKKIIFKTRPKPKTTKLS